MARGQREGVALGAAPVRACASRVSASHRQAAAPPIVEWAAQKPSPRKSRLESSLLASFLSLPALARVRLVPPAAVRPPTWWPRQLVGSLRNLVRSRSRTGRVLTWQPRRA